MCSYLVMALVKDGQDAQKKWLSDIVIIIITGMSVYNSFNTPHYYVVFFHLGTDKNNKQEAFIVAENVWFMRCGPFIV